MIEFDRARKKSGIYWLKKPIDDIKLRVRLKTLHGLSLLPKFEDYSTKNYHKIQDNKLSKHIFEWQEKVFSTFEYKLYSDINNCITETELRYNDMIQNIAIGQNNVFTYIHDDYRLPLPSEFKNKSTEKSIPNLNLCLEKLQLGENFRFSSNASSMRHLFRSEENMLQEEQWMAMHVMFDYSDYNEDLQLLLKREVPLVSLYYNTKHNYLMVKPNMNDIDSEPYMVETESGVKLGYEYDIDIDFGEEDSEELMILMQKLSKKWKEKHKNLLQFVMPPLGRKQYLVTFEIVTAQDFEMDNLYVEYTIKVAEEVKCESVLHGRTHRSKSIKEDDKTVWNFGHYIELNLETESNPEPTPLQMFLEVISTDLWSRRRTEGYAHLPIALSAGFRQTTLTCRRPEESDRIEAETRRFFIGGCHLLPDLDVLAKPLTQETNYNFVSTGTVSLRWNILTQTHKPGISNVADRQPVTSASALLMGADAVLRQYRKARARLAAATKDLEDNTAVPRREEDQ